ncbi:MAG: CHASE3 domain-containing protein [Prolixibacteraceae bacterium]|nr:CHASE3 domain-containing protein [Prolixibacteraceae bacterium]
MKIANYKLSSLLLKGALLVAIVALFFVAAISYKQIQSLNESGKSVFHSYEVNIELERLNSYAKDAESGQRGFILTKDSSFLKSYYSALYKAHESINKLKKLTSGNFQQSKELDNIVNLLDLRFNFLENVLTSNDYKITATDTLKGLIIKGRELMTHVHNHVDKVVSNEMEFLSLHEIEHEKDIILSPFSILFIVILSMVVFILAYYKIKADLKRLTKANNKLLINKEIFEQSEQLADMGNWCWETETNDISYSKNLYHLLGCEPDEFTPTVEKYLTFVHPDDRENVINWCNDISKGILVTSITSRIIRKDGVLRYFKSNGRIINDIFGKTFAIGVTADITEQQDTNRIIEDKVAQLEKSNKELLAFNHIASHDLQEPLRKVQTFISRIRENDFETLPEKLKDYILGIERASVRMGMFIEDLLMYSRSNNVDKVFELTDLNVLLENSIQQFSQQIEEKKAVVKLLTKLPTLYVISFQIQQLFNNLLSNSLKYSKPDTAPVIVFNTKILQSTDLPGLPTGPYSKYYIISISDNGIGFEQKYAGQIFTLFYRLHNKSEYSGTGVGLAICKLIVENHKGFIMAEGIPNKGTTIVFYLPA